MPSGRYSIRKLEELAADRDFAWQVRTFVGALFAAGAVNDTRNVAPLLQYGPRAPGTAIRLGSVHQFADLDAKPEFAHEWARLVARLQVAVADA